MAGFLRWPACAVGALTLLICAPVAGAAQAAHVPATSAVAVPRVPSPGTINQLRGVQALSPTDAWAAGYFCKSCTQTEISDRTLILHWNGTTWAKVPSPNPGAGNILMGISADSATDAWAVGYYCTGTCPEQLPLLLHWNGTAWSPVPGPKLTAGGFLASVAAVSPSDAWAAGTSGLGKTLILHWDGTAWSQVASPSPNPSDLNTLSGVSADSATDAWAVGNYCAKNCFTSSEVFNSLILHWNGTTWSKVPRPSLAPGDNGLESVSAVSPTAAFASGSFIGGTLILQWNGTSWSKAKAPNVFTALSGISASSATDAWAVGGASFLHWNGATWSTVAIPGPSTNFFGASTGSATNAWAVGGYCTTTSCTNYATAALHWNGNTWTRT